MTKLEKRWRKRSRSKSKGKELIKDRLRNWNKDRNKEDSERKKSGIARCKTISTTNSIKTTTTTTTDKVTDSSLCSKWETLLPTISSKKLRTIRMGNIKTLDISITGTNSSHSTTTTSNHIKIMEFQQMNVLLWSAKEAVVVLSCDHIRIIFLII
jgi:hypothetical protein